MATIEENRAAWDADYDWSQAGDEWSTWWGSAEAQWRWSLLPRIGSFVPASTTLEIAPGFGRWTHYLKELSERLIVVDLSPRCIETCRHRFALDSNISYHVNDGVSLEMVPDGSVDFVFSFDSLVHAEAEVLEGYVRQLARKLTPNGVCFIHHSNWGEYHRYFRATDRIPSARARKALARVGMIDGEAHWRARSVSAASFERLVRAAGMQCVSQELVNWGTKRLCDSISVFTMPSSRWARQNVVVSNPGFMTEARCAKRAWAAYAHDVPASGGRSGSIRGAPPTVSAAR